MISIAVLFSQFALFVLGVCFGVSVAGNSGLGMILYGILGLADIIAMTCLLSQPVDRSKQE